MLHSNKLSSLSTHYIDAGFKRLNCMLILVINHFPSTSCQSKPISYMSILFDPILYHFLCAAHVVKHFLFLIIMKVSYMINYYSRIFNHLVPNFKSFLKEPYSVKYIEGGHALNPNSFSCFYFIFASLTLLRASKNGLLFIFDSVFYPKRESVFVTSVLRLSFLTIYE